MFTYKRASSEAELTQILAIQKRNMKVALTMTEIETEGFITVDHDFDILHKMNAACAHIIAKDGNSVVGYALAMLPSFRNEIPILTAMFDAADALLKGKNYMAMGQICIDKPYRKKGIFKGLYTFYKEELQNEYDCLVTEVARKNTRSLQAHLDVGFEILKTRLAGEATWELLNWDWNK